MTDFHVTILGSGAALPTERRQCSAQVVQVHNTFFLIDCGENTQVSLRKQKIKMLRIGSIFISHLHGDHFLGLPGLLFSLHLLGRTEPLTIYSPKGLKEIMDLLIKVSNTTLRYPLNFVELSGNQNKTILETGLLKVKQIPLKHQIETYGFLVEEKQPLLKIQKAILAQYSLSYTDIQKIKKGDDYVSVSGEKIPNNLLTHPPKKCRKYAYCSDTAYFPEMIPFIQEVDLLYHESTFSKEETILAEEKFHTTSAQAAEIARTAQVGQLILGHISARHKDATPLLDEAKLIFPNTLLAEDGMKISI